MSSGIYSTSAKYYDDAYAIKPDLVDLPFYVDLAKQIGGPVLEMGCGTGVFSYQSHGQALKFTG